VTTAPAVADMICDALISEDGAYRYTLTRRWSGRPLLPWICLNPSTADASKNDPSVLRMCRFSRRENYGGICILNEYALRSPHPSVLRTHPDPVGPDNDMWISAVAGNLALSRVIDGSEPRPVVVAWGANPMAAARVPRVMELLAGIPVVCLGTTASGAPKHPLARGRERVPDDAPMIPWKVP
jgi:hypothetical protein